MNTINATSSNLMQQMLAKNSADALEQGKDLHKGAKNALLNHVKQANGEGSKGNSPKSESQPAQQKHEITIKRGDDSYSVTAESEKEKEIVDQYIDVSTKAGMNNKSFELGLRFIDKQHGEANIFTKPTEATGRPEGDKRSAEEIIDANPVLKNLGNQKDIKRDLLMERCGDWTSNNPDPEARADAAYNMAQVLNYIDNTATTEGAERENAADGDIQGITKDGDARRGTEAGMLKDFAEGGYDSLPDSRRLDETNDKHVRENGSNKDTWQYIAGEAAEALDWVPGMNVVWTPMLEGLSEGEDLGDSLVKGVDGALGGMMEAAGYIMGGPVGWATFAIDEGLHIGSKIEQEIDGDAEGETTIPDSIGAGVGKVIEDTTGWTPPALSEVLGIEDVPIASTIADGALDLIPGGGGKAAKGAGKGSGGPDIDMPNGGKGSSSSNPLGEFGESVGSPSSKSDGFDPSDVSTPSNKSDGFSAGNIPSGGTGTRGIDMPPAFGSNGGFQNNNIDNINGGSRGIDGPRNTGSNSLSQQIENFLDGLGKGSPNNAPGTNSRGIDDGASTNSNSSWQTAQTSQSSGADSWHTAQTSPNSGYGTTNGNGVNNTPNIAPEAYNPKYNTGDPNDSFIPQPPKRAEPLTGGNLDPAHQPYGQGIPAGNSLYDFNPIGGQSPAYEMTSNYDYHGKPQEFANWMNPWKTSSDINTNRPGMDPSLNTQGGRVGGSLTNSYNPEQMANNINNMNLGPEGSMNLNHSAGASINPRIHAPDLVMLGGVPNNVGAGAFVGAKYEYGNTHSVDITTPNGKPQVTGSTDTNHYGGIEAFGGVKVHGGNGAVGGDLTVGATAEVGVNHNNHSSGSLGANQNPGQVVTDFAANNGHGSNGLNNGKWDNVQTETSTTVPAGVKVEATANMGVDHGHKSDNTGVAGVVGTAGFDDLKNPMDTKHAGWEVTGQVQTDAHATGPVGAMEQTNVQGPAEHSKTGQFGGDTGKKGSDYAKANGFTNPPTTYHGSHYNHVTDPKHHIKQLDKQYGEGVGEAMANLFKQKYGADTPYRNMQFDVYTRDDGKVLITGVLDTKAGDGVNVKVPYAGYSQGATGNIHLDEPMLVLDPKVS